MVTYEQICESWETYHAAPCLASWQALWLLVRDCVGPIITNAIKHDAPLDRDDIDDATDDITCTIMESMRVIRYIDVHPLWLYYIYRERKKAISKTLSRDIERSAKPTRLLTPCRLSYEIQQGAARCVQEPAG